MIPSLNDIYKLDLCVTNLAPNPIMTSGCTATGGLVQVIPAEVLKPSDLVRQREILGACLEQHHTYLIGHEVHKWIPEWDAVA